MTELNPKNKQLEEKMTNLRSIQLGRIPPQALDMEQAVLGALLLEKNALHRVTDVLKPEMFYKDSHKAIFEAVLQLFQNSEAIDILTVKDVLRKNGTLEQAGGAYYLAELTSRVASAANIEYHARVIAEKFILRQLILISDGVIKDAYDETTDVFELLDKTEQSLFEVSETHLRRNYLGMPELVMKTLARIEELRSKDESITGISSGFNELDKLTSGWQRTDLVIIAARPAMGKCLGKGTRIILYDGSLKKVEDIKVGDLLMGDDSTPRKVLSLARGRENMYWIRQQNAIHYRVNESHILSLKNENGQVKNMSVTDYLKENTHFQSDYKGYKVAIDFPEISTQTQPYFVGFWLGNEAASQTQFSFANEHQVNEQAVFSFEKNNLSYLQKSHSHQIPSDHLYNSTQNRLELLAGLIDAAGHFNLQKNSFELVFSTKKFAEQVKFLTDSLGFCTNLISENEAYRLEFSGNLAQIPVRIDAKKAPFSPIQSDWQRSLIQVELDKEDEYFGFTIDGNHLFLLEDGTVTHNTAFTLTVARNAAHRNVPVAFFSLEMAAVQLTQRLVCAEAELDAQKVRTGKLESYEWQQLITRIGTLSNAPIFIDDTPGISIMDLRAKCRRLKAEKKIEMVVIDYLQLMTGNASKGGNREQEIAGISRALKELAKELDVCVIALSQLSRAVETRGGDKKPQLSDLRESGSIEQDADMVMALYRPEYYGFETDEEGNSTAGLAEVIILKQRNGPTGTARLQFMGKFGKFADLNAYSSNSPNTFSSALNQSTGDPSKYFSGATGDMPNIITLPSKMNEDLSGDDSQVPF